MLKELYTAALGMIPQQNRLEVLANNIANANTAGFKRESVFERYMINAQENLNSIKGDAEQEDPPSYTYTDFSSGNVERTGNPLDVAIDSPNGYFILQDEEGRQFYSRAGHFVLGNDGHIRTADGLALMGESGPILLDRTFAAVDQPGDNRAINVRIEDDGEVFANEMPLGRIQLATVENPQTLVRESGTHFSESEETNISMVPHNETRVRQGYSENSNVDIIKEMVEMIELQRLFETGQKVIQTNDGTLDRAIDIGRFM